MIIPMYRYSHNIFLIIPGRSSNEILRKESKEGC